MAGLARMHEEGGRAGRGEGGGKLLADVAALADAGDDHAALGGGQRRHGHAEGLLQVQIERGPQRLQALALEVERAHGRLRRVRVERLQMAWLLAFGRGAISPVTLRCCLPCASPGARGVVLPHRPRQLRNSAAPHSSPARGTGNLNHSLTPAL